MAERNSNDGSERVEVEIFGEIYRLRTDDKEGLKEILLSEKPCLSAKGKEISAPSPSLHVKINASTSAKKIMHVLFIFIIK